MPDADRQAQRTTGAAKGAEAVKGADATRKQDHAGIARLTEELLPALIAKLGTTHLGELEVREGEWHVRLRRPFGTAPGEGRRVTDKPSRSQPGHEGHGHGRAAPEGTRGSKAGAGRVRGESLRHRRTGRAREPTWSVPGRSRPHRAWASSSPVRAPYRGRASVPATSWAP